MGMDREKWLAIRNTPRKTNREKMIHVSTNFERYKAEDGSIKTVRVGKGTTLRSKEQATHVESIRRTQNKGG